MESLRRLAQKLRTMARRHGWRNAISAGLLKLLRHPHWLQVLRAHHVEEPHADFLDVPQSYGGGFLAPRALAQFSCDAQAGISEEFLQYALGKGDKCFGFNYNGELRAYGWYSTKPTRISPGLSLSFSRDYVYMYKGYTHPLHRGRRLFPIGMTRALKHYRAAGYKGLLLYVDAANLDSLKSCARMGFRPFGTIFVLKILDRHFVFATPGCAHFGLRVEVALPPGISPRWA